MRTLNYRQRLFVCHYLGKAAGNETEAAKLAGYLNPESTGSKLVQHPLIYAAIQSKLEDAAMQADEVLARLSDIASADYDEFLREEEFVDGVNAHGEPALKKRIVFDYAKAKSRKKTHLIKKLKIDKDGSVEFELHSAPDALEKLAKVHGLFKEKLDVNVSIGNTEEDRQRYIAVFGGFAQLEGSAGTGADGSETEPGALCDSGEQGALDPGTSSNPLEPCFAEGGDGG